MRICLVEDDLELGRALDAALHDGGCRTVWVRRLADARALLVNSDGAAFDAALLDLTLPDGDALALVRELRAARPGLALMIISARDALDDRLRGLDLGADDYLVKPFAAAELLARLHAVVRRTRGGDGEQPGVWRVGGVVLDEPRRLVERDGVRIALSKAEFELLLALMRQPRRVLTRRELEARVLPRSDGASLDVHVSNLRRKLGDGCIRTVRGVGYAIEPP